MGQIMSENYNTSKPTFILYQDAVQGIKIKVKGNLEMSTMSQKGSKGIAILCL
jgi:hypothetical protein